MVEISRRDFIVGGSAILFAILIGCKDKSNVFHPKESSNNHPQDVLMANHEQVRIIHAREGALFTKDIGINRVGLFRKKDSDRYNIFYEFAQDVVPIPLGTRRNDPSLEMVSGLVPFDPNYDLSKAENYLKQDKRTASETFDDTARIGNIFASVGLEYGYMAYDLIPELYKDFMYYIGGNLFI